MRPITALQLTLLFGGVAVVLFQLIGQFTIACMMNPRQEVGAGSQALMELLHVSPALKARFEEHARLIQGHAKLLNASRTQIEEQASLVEASSRSIRMDVDEQLARVHTLGELRSEVAAADTNFRSYAADLVEERELVLELDSLLRARQDSAGGLRGLGALSPLPAEEDGATKTTMRDESAALQRSWRPRPGPGQASSQEEEAQFEGRIPRQSLELVSPEYSTDPEGVFFYEVDQLLATVPNRTLLDIGCGGGRLLHRFGQRFEEVVALDVNASALDIAKSNFSHANVKFLGESIFVYQRHSGQRFDVIFLVNVLQQTAANLSTPMLTAVRKLLHQDGVAIIATTYVDEGKGGFRSRVGVPLTAEEFKWKLDRASPSTPTASRVGILALPSHAASDMDLPTRWWTKRELWTGVEEANMSIVSHSTFAYNTPAYARKLWNHVYTPAGGNRPRFWDLVHVPVAQMAAARASGAAGGAAGARPASVPSEGVSAEPVAPSSPDVKHVAFALVRGGEYRMDYDFLVDSRRCFRAAMALGNASQAARYDDVVFHEGNVPARMQMELQAELPGMRFVDARRFGAFGGFDAPPRSARARRARPQPWERLRRPGEYTVGYRHMCMLMTMQWMLALRRYEYAMRIDDDVCIHKAVDPFQALRDAGAVYGSGLLTDEKHDETVKTLQPWLDFYVFSRGIQPKMPPVDAQTMYFTNFFVSQVSWWFQDAVQLFLAAVARSGFIYEHRWGDAPLQTAALHLFAEPARVLVLPVDYTHLSTLNEITNGSEVTFKAAGPAVAEHWAALSAMAQKGDNSGYLASIVEPYLEKWEPTFNDLLAPCLVANYFNLPGAPFTAEPNATASLKQFIFNYSGMPRKKIEQFSTLDLAKIVQFDIHRSLTPLPPEYVYGQARKNAMFQLVSGQNRADPLSKTYTQLEYELLVNHTCCEARHTDLEQIKAMETFMNGFGKPAMNLEWGHMPQASALASFAL